MTIDLDHLKSWVGKTETMRETIGPFPANALAATLNRNDPLYQDGTPLPPLWHWLHFLPIFKLEDSGYDGHAALGGFLPPVHLPRRMWAGGRLMFHNPLRIGQALRKTSTVKSVDHKTGRSGDLVFVTVRHEIFDQNNLCTSEEHDIVYRDRPAADASHSSELPAPTTSDFSRTITPDPVLLFRYSALTFNGHRIHYDQPFCTNTEGYRGLVVHGPLLATLLLDLLRRERPDATIVSFDFRAIAPVFETQDFSVHGRFEQDNTVHLWVRRYDGTAAMQAKARLKAGNT